MFCDGHSESVVRNNVIDPNNEMWYKRWSNKNIVEGKWTVDKTAGQQDRSVMPRGHAPKDRGRVAPPSRSGWSSSILGPQTCSPPPTLHVSRPVDPLAGARTDANTVHGLQVLMKSRPSPNTPSLRVLLESPGDPGVEDGGTRGIMGGGP